MAQKEIESVKKGEKRRLSLTLGGCEPLEAWVINGAGEGKTIVVTSGVHGCEYLGPTAARRAAEELNPEEMNGRVVILPLLNPNGFYLGEKRIMPEDGKNLNRAFPGNAGGSYSQRLAAAIESEIYPLADFFADLHGGDVYEELTPLVFFPAAAGESVERESLAAVMSLSAPLLIASSAKDGVYSRAAQLGIPSLLLERGCHGEWSKEGEDAVFCDVMRLLAHLNIIKRDFPRVAQSVVRRAVYEEAQERGCWRRFVKAGEQVRAGQILGELRKFDGSLIKQIKAAESATIMYVTVALGVTEGDSLVSYAII